MNRILILTKNISVEKYLQEQLQKLNHEVLVSVSIWENWENSGRIDPFINSFQWVFLSETISEGEAEAFGQQFNSNCLVRIVSEEPTEELIAKWLNWHIFDWLLSTVSLERLREKLTARPQLGKVDFNSSQTTQSFQEKQVVSNHKRKSFPLYFSEIQFTKLEKDIIRQLMAAENLSLARDELSKDWRSKNQNSKLCQLSSTVSKIRKKVEQTYGIEDAVITLWGEGYQLNTYFHRCLLKGEFQNKPQQT